MGQALGFRMKVRDTSGVNQNTPDDCRKEIKRQIYLAYEVGSKVPYELRTLIESGASLKVIRAVYMKS